MLNALLLKWSAVTSKAQIRSRHCERCLPPFSSEILIDREHSRLQKLETLRERGIGPNPRAKHTHSIAEARAQ